MNWRYKIQGGHTHVRVFSNGALCGHLVFRNAEFDKIRAELTTNDFVAFFNESEASFMPNKILEV